MKNDLILTASPQQKAVTATNRSMTTISTHEIFEVRPGCGIRRKSSTLFLFDHCQSAYFLFMSPLAQWLSCLCWARCQCRVYYMLSFMELPPQQKASCRTVIMYDSLFNPNIVYNGVVMMLQERGKPCCPQLIDPSWCHWSPDGLLFILTSIFSLLVK